MVGRPHARTPHPEARGERGHAVAADAAGAEVEAPGAEVGGHADALGAASDVAQVDAEPHGRGAGGAVEQRRDPHGLPVDGVEPLEVDLALDAAVVPPAAPRRAGGGEAGGREVGFAAPGVDPDHETVRAASLEAREAELEREVGAAVAADRPAVEPRPRAVVDRFEAHGPLQRAARLRQGEVLAVPPTPPALPAPGEAAAFPEVG